jgi:hypothetical protein
MSWTALAAAQPGDAPAPAAPPISFEILNDSGRAISSLRWFFPEGDAPAQGEAGRLEPGRSLRVTVPAQHGCGFRLTIDFEGTGPRHARFDRCRPGPVRLSAGRPLEEAAMEGPPGPPEPIPPPPPPPPPPAPPPLTMSAAPPRLRVRPLPRTMAAPPAPIVAAAPPDEAPPAPAAAAATAYCDILQDEASVADCAYYRDVLAHLKQGKAGLHAPPSMRVGETAQVSLALTRDEKSTSVETALGAAPTQRFALGVGRRMAAELTAVGFAIQPPARVEKDLGIGDAARWDWTVTAQPGARHELKATVYVIVRKPGVEPVERLVTTAVQPVKVTVPFVQRSEGWMDAASDWLGHLNKLQAALGALASGAVATWLIAWWRRRRGGGKPPA